VDFAAVRNIVFESYGRGDYEAGLRAIEDHQASNEDELADLAYWRMCLLSRLGRLEEACSVFARSLDRGFWWSEEALLDPDLDNLRSMPEWAQLVNASIGQAADARRVRRDPIDVKPANQVRTTLILLHGRAERPQLMIDRCASGSDQHTRLLALHGPEPHASNKYGWPLDGTERVVVDQWVAAGQMVDPILIGFSQGAGLAGWMAWSGRIPARGVILVAPAMSIRGVPIPSAALAPIPTFLLVGTDDWALDDTRRAAQGLEASGASVRLEEHKGLGHEWPPATSEWLPRAISWVMKSGTNV
jgi:predicted esterase